MKMTNKEHREKDRNQVMVKEVLNKLNIQHKLL